MPSGPQLLSRALAGVCMLAVVTQCSRSGGQLAAPPSTTATTNAGSTSVVDTTSPASTASSVVSSAVTSVVASTTAADHEPTTTTATALAVAVDSTCPTTAHAAVVDRDRQRAWLCDNGLPLPEFVITTAHTLPDPGTYPVFAKDLHTSSTFGDHFTTETHFVAFTRGENTGARIAFHTVPVLGNGEYVQPLDSVGALERQGDSAGCIRVRPEQGPVVWEWLHEGDEVRILT